MKIEASSTAVVVVDMQNDFAAPDGALYSEASEDVIPHISSLLSSARNNDAHVVFTRDIHTTEQFEGSNYYDEFDQWGEHVVEGSDGAELVDEFNPPHRDEEVIDKPTYDAFHNTGLDAFFERRGVETLLICGTLANVCVLHTASSAALRDYRPILVSDAIGYIEKEHKEYALEHAEWLFGETTERSDVQFV